MTYHASAHRYDSMVYRRCGQSGLKLPAITLGRWHNFGQHLRQPSCAKLGLASWA